MRLLLGRVFVAGTQAAKFLWTAPAILLSAFLVAWGAEAAQFMVSQGLALAILAWLQTLPEFAVEADIAWNAARHTQGYSDDLITANFTGSIRLIMGFGIPMVYFIYSRFWRGRNGRFGDPIRLDPAHSVEVVNMIPATLYLYWIWWKGRLEIWDSIVLLGFYAMYLALLIKMPPEEAEGIDELPAVSRLILRRKRTGRVLGLTAVFLAGGLLLYFSVHSFVGSLQDLAAYWGIPAFFFIQWIAPFLSEFPEKVSAFNWARQERKAPMAMMNFLSSNVNQMTVLAAMIPIVYCLGAGGIRPVQFDAGQRQEILLTACQATLLLFLLLCMRFTWRNAIGIFVLWGVQFFKPSLREKIVYVYLGWMALEVVLVVTGLRRWSFPLSFKHGDTALRRRKP